MPVPSFSSSLFPFIIYAFLNLFTVFTIYKRMSSLVTSNTVTLRQVLDIGGSTQEFSLLDGNPTAEGQRFVQLRSNIFLIQKVSYVTSISFITETSFTDLITSLRLSSKGAIALGALRPRSIVHRVCF